MSYIRKFNEIEIIEICRRHGAIDPKFCFWSAVTALQNGMAEAELFDCLKRNRPDLFKQKTERVDSFNRRFEQRKPHEQSLRPSNPNRESHVRQSGNGKRAWRDLATFECA
jgi:hypothetical protein